jgi:2-polyprenyl-3-methyl-5-hydroxy-6-metoxy-1,4-benzoquinol methylase
MDFNERMIPGISSNFLYQEAVARYKFASNYAFKGASILDLGCGTGYGSKYFKECSYVGIDINLDAVEFAKKNYGDYGEFQRFDIMKYNTSNKYDFIVIFEVIEHVKSGTKLLNNAIKLLKKNGKLFLSTPNKKITDLSNKEPNPYHVNEYDYLRFKKQINYLFKDTAIYGQWKSKKAEKAWKSFLKSQDKRQNLVDIDKFGIRKLFPRDVKEKIWSKIGNYFGRKEQDYLNYTDFPIKKINVDKSNYFIAICQKAK